MAQSDALRPWQALVLTLLDAGAVSCQMARQAAGAHDGGMMAMPGSATRAEAAVASHVTR